MRIKLILAYRAGLMEFWQTSNDNFITLFKKMGYESFYFDKLNGKKKIFSSK